MALPVDIYVRVSRVGARENLISPAEQERRGRQLARDLGLTVGRVLEDLDESGGKLERPGLQDALARVERRESAGIVVAWLDRLSRDSEHAHGIVRRIAEAGGSVYAPDAPADWTTPEGKLQAGIFFEMAQYVRLRARAGFESAKKQAIERGIPVNSRAAVGYLKGDDRRLVPDPRVAPFVRECFERRARGDSPGSIARFLEAKNVTTSQGATVWTRQAVEGMLKNRVYLGEIAYGKDRRFVNAHAHEPIVDLVTFELAQVPRPRSERSERSTYALTGLLRCHGCGYTMHATIDAHRHRTYRCGRRHSGGVCPAPARNRAEPLEDAVLAELKRHLPKKTARGRRAGPNVAALRAEQRKAEQVLEAWLAPAMQEAMIEEPELYARGTAERRALVKDARAAVEEAERYGHADTAHEITLAEWVDEMPVTELRSLLALRYDCIVLRRDPRELIVFPRGTGPRDLPRRGYRRDPRLAPFGDDLPDGVRVLPLK